MTWKNVFRTFLFLITVALIAGCSSAGSTDELFESDFVGSDENENLGGYELVFGISTDTDFGYEHETPMADLALGRISAVQSALNCRITQKYDAGLYDNVIASSASGVYYSDVIMEISVPIFEMFRTLSDVGTVIGISTTSIDYTDAEKWGSRYLLEAACNEDDVYALVPCLWPELVTNNYLGSLVVNEDLIARLGVEDPREYVEKGQWTWDKFEEVLPLYYREENGEVVHYSFATPNGDFSLMMIMSDGIRLSGKGSDGEYGFTFFSPDSIKAMETAYRIWNRDFKYCIHSLDPNSQLPQMFIENDSVMGLFYAKYVIGPASYVSKNMDNFGILTFPTGPNITDDTRYFSGYLNLERSIGFSLLTKDIDCAAKIVDRMYDPFESIGGIEGIKKYYASNYFFDERDANIFYESFINSRYMCFGGYYGINFSDLLWQYLESSSTVTTYLDQNKDKIQTQYEKSLAPCIRAIVSLWGEY